MNHEKAESCLPGRRDGGVLLLERGSSTSSMAIQIGRNATVLLVQASKARRTGDLREGRQVA